MNLESVIQAVFYTYYALISASVGVPTFFLALSLVVPKAGVVHAFLAASFGQFRTLLFRKWITAPMIAAPILYMLVTRRWDQKMVPPTDPTLRIMAHLTVVLVIWFWMEGGVAERGGLNVLALDLMDLPEMIHHSRLMRIRSFFLSAPLAFVAVRFPGPLCLFGVSAAVLLSAWQEQMHIRFLAMSRRFHANLASDTSSPEIWRDPFMLQLSDVHLTTEGERRTEGGQSGNRNLDLLASDSQRPMPRYLIVTGDLVDTGASTEYGQPVEPLRHLRGRGVRVIVSPGNHDLGTSYSRWTAYVFLSVTRPDLRVVDTSRLFRYLEFAAEMEPNLRCNDGKLLAEVLRRETSVIVGLQKRWQAVANEASVQLRRRRFRHLPQPEPSGIAVLSSVDSAAAACLLDPLIDEVMDYFTPPEFLGGAAGREQFRTALTSSPKCEFDPRFVAIRQKRLWTAIFPLRLFIEEDGLEFLIVNSVVAEPGLIGSAFGRLTSSQLERIRDAVSNTRARVLVVLMHHPIYGWEEEKEDEHNRLLVNTQRWGLLAHDLQESRQLFTIFKGAPNSCQQIVLCGGHRHGSSRAGGITRSEERESVDPRLRVCESNALPNLTQIAHQGQRNDLLCFKNKDGLIYPSRIGFDSLLGLK
jgi:3',5'-cyclic AMP phosphodiesterase CpdA